MKSKKTAAERARKPLKSGSPSTEMKAKNARSAEPSYGRLLAALVIVLALSTIAVYAQTAHYGFIAYDDDQYVYENAVVKTGITGTSLVWAATTFFYANWHPLTWLSYLVDVQLFGLNAGAFHVVNLLLHTANVILIFLVLFRMTRRPWRSAVVAAVFALHPLHVESVAWISERKDVLSTFLGIVALLLYLRYVERPTITRYLITFFAFALSLMAKPMWVTFPLLLLLLDLWPLRRLQWWPQWPRDRSIFVEKLPLLLLSLGGSILTFAAQRSFGAVVTVERYPLLGRLGNAAIAYLTYIKQAIWPVNLGVLYPSSPPEPGTAIIALLVIVGVTAIVLICARSKPYLFTGWFWYVGMLVPVIGIIQVGVQSRADRYMYVPLVGLTIAIVWGAADWVEGNPAMRHAAVAVTGLVLLLFAIGAWRQVRYWKDSQTLFEHTLAVTERNAIIRNNLGVVLARAKDAAGAINQYQQALAINSEYAEAHANLGHELLRAGQFDAAKLQLQEAIRLKPNFAIALADLGLLDAAGGHYEAAIRHLNESLRLSSDNAEAHSNLCYALQHAGQFNEAIAECREALRLKPGYADAEFNLKNAQESRR
jgi:Tfp pilus assembly protein PilF